MTTQTDQHAAGSATSAPASGTPPPVPDTAPAGTPPPTLDAQLAEALDRGIADAGAGTGTEPADTASANTQPPKRIDADAQDRAPAPGDAGGKPGDAAPSKPEDQAAAAEAVKTQQRQDAEQEIGSLGLKTKAAERFRAMHGELAELRPLRAAMEKAGIKDAADLPRVIERAKAADEWEGMVLSTGANPQQMGMAMDYLRMVNAGTPEALAKAYDVMQAELQTLAKALGREAPGIHDPLSEHPDLVEAVEAGDMTRRHAVELAQARQTVRLQATRTQHDRQQAEQQRALDTARTGLNQLGEQLRAADPDYERKLPFLMPVLRRIRETMPPERWLDEVRAAYAEIPALPAAPAPAPAPRAPVGHVPLRPAGGLRAPMQRAEYTDPMEALEAGIAAANGGA